MSDTNRLSQLFASLFGSPNLSPNQPEYNPAEAAMIAAGGTAKGLLHAGQAGYYMLRRNIADTVGDQATAQQYDKQADSSLADANYSVRAYRPLADIHPYSVAMGEALPAGVLGSPSLIMMARGNFVTTQAQELAKALKQEDERRRALATSGATNTGLLASLPTPTAGGLLGGPKK